jgi:tetratricopeptide (TPR) repeat protein
MLRKIIKIALLSFVSVIALALVLIAIFLFTIKIEEPEIAEAPQFKERVMVGPNHYTLGNNWLKKDKSGIWVIYIEGAPYERGLAYGKLCRELIQEQEEIFVDQINTLIRPGPSQKLIKYFIAWFNRDIDKYVPLEFRQEILGVSRSFSDEFDWVASKYQRVLNYHAAHDIGHALKDLAIVGCTSFSATGEFSEDSSLIVGRNFDFYMGPDFAKQRLLTVNKPNKGIAYASFSWAGLMGVVSGMNIEGLTVTINAAKSEMPSGAKDPISILAREVLQYASTIDEAVAICQKREVFVSEILLVASANEDRSVLIEVSPSGSGVLDEDDDLLICANHYQSEAFINSEANLENLEQSDSKYRYELMQELLNEHLPVDPNGAAAILSDPFGKDGENIGMGNSKTIDQFIGHHSIIFKPVEHLLWISAYPNQIVGYYAFDLNALLHSSSELTNLSIDTLNIQAGDPKIMQLYKSHEKFMKLKRELEAFIQFDKALDWDLEKERTFIEQNPNSYVVHATLGQYYLKLGNNVQAAEHFEKALLCEVASVNEIEKINALLSLCHE